MKRKKGETEYTDYIQDKEYIPTGDINVKRQALEERIKTNGYCCWECGTKSLEENGWSPVSGVTTCHNGICVVCGKETSVTHIRNYRWLRRKTG